MMLTTDDKNRWYIQVLIPVTYYFQKSELTFILFLERGQFLTDRFRKVLENHLDENKVT
jgi:hypothetical protein